MANARNQASLEGLRQVLEGADSFYLVDYQGLSATQIAALRRQVVESGGRLLVTKNTLLKLATAQKHDFSDLRGPTALVLIGDDPAKTAKALLDFAGGNDLGVPSPKGGMLEGRAIGKAVVERLAKLGNRDALRAELVGVLSAQLSNFVGILEALAAQRQAQA
jgi:large subunit ribosomal protein L10